MFDVVARKGQQLARSRNRRQETHIVRVNERFGRLLKLSHLLKAGLAAYEDFLDTVRADNSG